MNDTTTTNVVDICLKRLGQVSIENWNKGNWNKGENKSPVVVIKL